MLITTESFNLALKVFGADNNKIVGRSDSRTDKMVENLYKFQKSNYLTSLSKSNQRYLGFNKIAGPPTLILRKLINWIIKKLNLDSSCKLRLKTMKLIEVMVELMKQSKI